MIYPKFLQPGSQILVISPSDGNSEPLAESRITMAANKFEKEDILYYREKIFSTVKRVEVQIIETGRGNS